MRPVPHSRRHFKRKAASVITQATLAVSKVRKTPEQVFDEVGNVNHIAFVAGG
jgi:hypothetical protein